MVTSASRGMLQEILHTRFGFKGFRAKQEAICQAVTDGFDALVVMPTGAGKSLCYQIPGLARAGTTLVISPLVALIEDQVHQLTSRGIKAGRIHSGRTREDSRETFRAYLQNELEFLFIAPERLGVPGFSDMLRRHPPSLIAVDEAHCISQWGHDFRPDYRLVGERLQGLEQTPIIALTATATEIVQKDICTQLKLRSPKLFIHGFRRENLAIQLMDTLPSERIAQIEATLIDPARLPAIVYAPTRKKAEEIADALKSSKKWKAAAYHAGMTAGDRDKVQSGFISGVTDVIVATVAFGMGIDKANVRTVIHAALPGNIESYYQEIGRAGRDGLPSQALLLYSFSDRKTHEFFLDRDHPDTATLLTVWKSAPKSGSITKADLRLQNQGMETDTFEKAVEKLWLHGGLRIDSDENIEKTTVDWMNPYAAQRKHRVGQLDAIQNFTQKNECRMLQLIKHFGDVSDISATCGRCDRCLPTASARTLDKLELSAATIVLASLSGRDGQAVGRLFEEVTSVESKLTRSHFERILSAMDSAGLFTIEQTEFTRDGKTIPFRRVSLLSKGVRATRATLESVEISGPSMASAEPKARSKVKPKLRKRPASTPKDANTSKDVDAPSEMPKLFEELRAWRLSEARTKGVPAFRILSDRVLMALCEELPTTEEALLKISGIGPKLVRQYGDALIQVLRSGSR